MKLKIYQLINAVNVNPQEPPKALDRLREKELSVDMSLRLSKVTRLIADELKDFVKVRDGLVEKYGVKDEQGGIGIKPGDPNWSQFVEAYNKLLEADAEVGVTPISMDELRFEGVRISSKDLEALEFLFIESTE